MDLNSIIIDTVDQNIRVTVITEAPEAFADRVKNGHLVKYAKNIQKKLHLPHNMELTHGGDLKTSVLFSKPLTFGNLASVTAAISDMAALCQMRKSRRIILGTSQVYGRIAKPIREQLKYLIVCRNYLHVIQHNILCDPIEVQERNGTINPLVLGEKWWFHSPELYQSYETFKKIQRVKRTGDRRQYGW